MINLTTVNCCACDRSKTCILALLVMILNMLCCCWCGLICAFPAVVLAAKVSSKTIAGYFYVHGDAMIDSFVFRVKKIPLKNTSALLIHSSKIIYCSKNFRTNLQCSPIIYIYTLKAQDCNKYNVDVMLIIILYTMYMLCHAMFV